MDRFDEEKLGDLFEIKAGGDLLLKYYSTIKTEKYKFPIYSNTLENKGLYGYTSKPRFVSNSITITGRGYLGRAEYREVDFDAIVRLLVLIPKKEINCKYVTYYINNYLRFPIESTGVPQLTAPKVSKSKVKLPSFQEQTAIAAILSKVDEAIEATTQSIKAAEKLKKALMQNLLSGKLKPDGTWRTEDEFYEDEKFGRVPKEWKVMRVKDIFDFFPTASYSRSTLIENGEVRYIHYGDIHTKFDRILDLDNDPLPFIPLELKKKFEVLKDGDLVISDASEDWVGVGKSIEIKNISDKIVIAGLHTLHLRQKYTDLIQGIKGYILNMENVANNVKRLATGIKVYGISKPNLGRVLIPIPSKPEQEFIKAKLDACSNEIQQKQSKINTLERLKKSLMQHLLTGKKRLSKETITHINQTF